jgi:cobalt-zinc-cadmium resistance protein CzcA
MPARIVDFALNNRWLVLLALAAFSIFGVYTAASIPIDAFPDLTNNQVVVATEAPAMPPTEVEQLVTFPIETALMGLPNTLQIRSISKMGLSVVTVIFADSVNTYFARQLVNERLLEVRARLPAGIMPMLGPVATAFGEVYQYTVEGPMSLMERKTLQDWQIRYQLRTVPGVNEVNSWGGFTKRYTVEVDPLALQRYGLVLRDVFERIRANNENFGGGFIEHDGEQYNVLGVGRVHGVDDIGRIVLLEHNGTPVLLRDVAKIRIGSVPRQGAVLRGAKGETVSGMVIMLKGANGRQVIQRVKARIAELHLPKGVRLVPFYDQSMVIDSVIHTVTHNLIEAGVLVISVLLLFLGNIRAALIVAAVIPLSMLFGFIGMAIFGVSANLMSLGAIDFGMIVDGAVVMMENSVRRLAEHHDATVTETVRHAASEVARPIIFAVAIIIAVYIPVLGLTGLAGRMFRPMAITVCSALVGSLILALTVVPVLGTLALRAGIEERAEGWFIRLRERYSRSLETAFRHRGRILLAGAATLVLALGSLAFIGTEFMPKLDEGSILIQTRKLPGISLTDSIRLSEQVEKVVKGFPEVRDVVTKIGRPDVPTEAMGVYEADVYVMLKPRSEWKVASKEQLIEQMDARLSKIPGVVYNFTQPMAMRLDEVVSGIKADVALKIFGEKAQTLEELAAKALKLVATVPGAADAQAEVISGVPELRIRVNREALARYGLNVTDVQGMVDAATGGYPVSELIDGPRRFPVAVRLPASYREDLGALGRLVLQAPAGERVRLNQVAEIELRRGPEAITRENGQRRIVVQANVRGRDLGSFVADAQRLINAKLALPPGYWVEWGGQFENQQRAMKRLALVLPISIALIFGLLFTTFRSLSQTLLILLDVPFALVGGIAALWLRGLNLNLSASVGFIALFGVAVLNGIVMVSYINRLREEGLGIQRAIRQGAATRLRPVLMTALVASLGFIPMATSQAPGAEVQRPLATVVIGGLLTSTALTLYLLPLLYSYLSPPDVEEASGVPPN